jgi:hypothetical protein
MKMKKLQSIEECDPEWIKETVKALHNNNVNNLSEYQRKMLCDQYLEKLRDGLKPKEAIEKALKIVLCFN